MREGVVGVSKVLEDKKKTRRSFHLYVSGFPWSSQLLQGEQQTKVLADLGHGKIAQSQVEREEVASIVVLLLLATFEQHSKRPSALHNAAGRLGIYRRHGNGR